MKKKFMCMLMAAAMTLSMAACGSKGDDANTDDNAGGASDGVQTFTVGTSGPLTGDNAIYGMAVKQGVELAVNEINASDSTIKFEFLSQDDEADGEKAVNAGNMHVIQYQYLQQYQTDEPPYLMQIIDYHSSFSRIFCSSCPLREMTRTLLTFPKSVANFIFSKYESPS